MTRPLLVSGRYYLAELTVSDDGVTAQCVDLPQAISEGATEEEALRNLEDAIRAVIQFQENKNG